MEVPSEGAFAAIPGSISYIKVTPTERHALIAVIQQYVRIMLGEYEDFLCDSHLCSGLTLWRVISSITKRDIAKALGAHIPKFELKR